MGTNRASGTVFTPRGVNQGTTLIDPNTGRPVDVIEDGEGVKRLAVDGNFNVEDIEIGDVDIQLTSEDDAVRVEDPDTGYFIKPRENGSIDVNVGTVNTPTIDNLVMGEANIEVPYVLPQFTKRFKLRARGLSKIQLSYTTGETNTNFITISPGTVYEERDFSILTNMYFRASKANEIIEILSWI